MRLPYTLEYFPPAPVLEIRLALPGHAFDRESVRALLDTGSDTSVIPLRYIQRLGAQIDDRKYVRGAWGERRAVYTYQLDVEVAEMRLPNIEVVADELQLDPPAWKADDHLKVINGRIYPLSAGALTIAHAGS